LCLVVGSVLAPPAAVGAPPGQYSAPEWLPLRHDVNGGGVKVGCTYASPDGLCAGHHGYWAIDFLGTTGSPVYAAGAGLATDVTGAGYEGYGSVVVVDHGNNGRSLYAHLDEVLVAGGSRWVDQNDQIGTIGSTGGANTPHLHYEESSSGSFGSAGSRDPGPMKACRGVQLITYPQVWGGSGWRATSWGVGDVDSDGSACAVVSGVVDALGAGVAAGLTAVKPTAHAGPDQILAADFNGDGVADVGFRNAVSGLFTLRHGPSFTGRVTYPWAPGATYQAFTGDFNADRNADIGLRDSASGTFYIKHGPTFADQVTYQWTAGDHFQVLAADFNADRRADIGLRDTSTGLFGLRNGPTFETEITYQSVPGTEYQVVAADFNGDRTGDIGLRNADTGLVAVNNGPTYAGQRTFPWVAGPNHQAFAADFNNDGVADIGLQDGAVPILDIRHGPTFATGIATPLDPRLDGVSSLLGGLFATLAARSF
jgi:Peptidase family M23